MTVQQLIEVLQASGWLETRTDENCHCLRQATLQKAVTISGKLELAVPRTVLRVLKRYAQLGE